MSDYRFRLYPRPSEKPVMSRSTSDERLPISSISATQLKTCHVEERQRRDIFNYHRCNYLILLYIKIA